jgi:hypothetical protein
LEDLASDIANAKPRKGVGFDSDYDSDDLPAQESKLRQERYQQNTLDRKWLAIWTAFIVTFWLIAVITIVIYSKCWELSDAVIMTLLGTTTLNVLGLSFIVLRGHFRGELDSL